MVVSSVLFNCKYQSKRKKLYDKFYSISTCRYWLRKYLDKSSLPWSCRSITRNEISDMTSMQLNSSLNSRQSKMLTVPSRIVRHPPSSGLRHFFLVLKVVMYQLMSYSLSACLHGTPVQSQHCAVRRTAWLGFDVLVVSML